MMRSCHIKEGLTCLCGMLLLMLCGCDVGRERVVLTGTEAFREGDLVLRCGWGVESQAVVESSRSIYSHIGILHEDSVCGEWMVLHAVPGEADKGESEYLKCEKITEFFAPERAKCGAWMRVDCADSVARNAARYALEENVMFDNDYLLTDTTQLYCTELVFQAYLHQGMDISDGNRHDVPLLFSKDGECLFPVDIEESTKILFVQPFKTQQQ